MTTRNATLHHMESEYVIVDVSDNSTTVYDGPCVLFAVYVNTVLSAHTCPIKDGTVTVATLAASSAVGTVLACPGIRMDTSLVVDPNDSGTGSIAVCFRKINPDTA